MSEIRDAETLSAARVAPMRAQPRAVPDPWVECEPEINSKLLRPMLRFYRQQFGQSALDRLAADLGTSLAVLEDPDRWFSTECFKQLHAAMTTATGDPDIVYKAGRAITRPGVMGPERALIRALLSVRSVLKNWPGIAARYQAKTDWSIQLKARGHATAIFRKDAESSDDIELCRNRAGTFESIPELFELPPARVEHPECIHRGDEHCRYEIRWLERLNILRTSLLMTLLSSVACVTLHLQESPYTALLAGGAVALMFVSCIAFLTSPRGTEGLSAPISDQQIDEMRDLLNRNRRRVQELQAIGAVTAAMRTRLDEGTLIASVLEALRNHLGYPRVMLLLVLPERGVLGSVRARGFGTNRSAVEALELSLGRSSEEHPRLFASLLTSGQPILVEDARSLRVELHPDECTFLTQLSTQAFVAAPVGTQKEQLGLLFVDQVEGEEPLTPRDSDLLSSVASTLGAALSNARLFARVQQELLINRKFHQYLPPQVVEEVRLDPKAALQLGGQEVELAVMLFDIAAFTPTSAALSAEEVVTGLNTWFGITDPIIQRCNGIVDKRMGDGVLVVFLPEEGDRSGRHPVERAAAAAVGIQQTLDGNRDLFEKQAPGFAKIEVRYAIHYGPVTIGNFGSSHRMEYTVIGDAVNRCSRLEEITPANCIWLTGEAVEAPGGSGLAGAEFERSLTLRDYKTVTKIWSIPVDSRASRTGTWALSEEDYARLKAHHQKGETDGAF
ncbi:MAG: adenylate/guanylate cyclase domain-containing protein [Myxococcota bacterium]|nr:adenylate/guanylate cyclase domain-containing protein [Myxococcota bacterium]